MEAKISHGYYGPRNIYYILGRPLFMRTTLPNRKEFRLIISRNQSFPIFIRPIYPKFHEVDKFNTEFLKGNLETFNEIDKARKSGKKIFLYAINNLEATGGVERRLALLFSWLKKKGILPVLVCEENNYEPLSDIPTIRIKTETPNIDRFILEIVERTKASILEFQLKCQKALHTIDLDALRGKIRIGCMVHGITEGDQSIFDKLDYRATSSTHANNYAGFITIPNVVEFPTNYPDFHLNSQQAIYIGRIVKEKLPTIRNFINLCKANNIDYKLAGPLSDEQEIIEFIAKLPSGTCIGPINTRSFLAEHGGDFLFVAGVGQVPLEAVAANIPALVTPHSVDVTRSTFLTAENLASIRDWNCVIKDGKIPKELAPGNSSDFFDSLQEARESKSLNTIQKFRIRSILEEQLSEDVIWGKYLELTKGPSTP